MMKFVVRTSGVVRGEGECADPVRPAEEPPALSWSEDLLTGHAAMDTTHQSFVSVTQALLSAGDAQLLERLQAFQVHAQAHFGEEDALMRSSTYPSAGCHAEEHAAVLKSVAEVIDDVAVGELRIGRRLAAELARWFPEHTEHMDKSLAAWLFRQSTGAARVVFRPDARAGTRR